MDSVGKYVISLCAAAMICSIIKSLSEKTGVSSKIIQALCGVFLTVTAIRPLLTLKIADISDISQLYRMEAETITVQALREADQAREEIIKDQLQAYILDKAASLGAQIEVEILLNEDDNSLPCGVIIKGNISPYGKKRLTEILESDLGLDREAQQWMN